MEVDDDMEQYPENFPLVDTTAADTLFEGHTWGWDGIYRRDVVAQNQNEPSFKNVWIPQIFSYIDIFLHCLHIKGLMIVPFPQTLRDMKEEDIFPITYGYLLQY